jgi:hypothetical protein
MRVALGRIHGLSQGAFQNYTMTLPYGGYIPPGCNSGQCPCPPNMVPSGVVINGVEGCVYGSSVNPQPYGGTLGPSGGIAPQPANTPTPGSGVSQSQINAAPGGIAPSSSSSTTTATCSGIGIGSCIGPLDAGTWALIAAGLLALYMGMGK